MDELIRQLTQLPDGSTAPDLLTALCAMLLAFALSLAVVYTYRETHTGPSYSQSQAHTLVIMSVVTAVIMLVIGSNIARAFSLIGALSVIRFRSAVKDPRDVGFLYFAMAIGMATGTRFFAIATLLTCFVCGISFFLTRFQIGAKPLSEALLRVVLAEGQDAREPLEAAFGAHLSHWVLLSAEAIGGGQRELTYSVQLSSGADEEALVQALQAVEGAERVAILRGLQGVHADV